MKSITEMTVRGFHVDHFGHVNHGRFVELLEDARWQYIENNNLFEVIHDADAVHVVSRLEIDYECPARVSDNLKFEAWVSERSSYGFCMSQKVYLANSGKRILKAKVFNVFINHLGKPGKISRAILSAWPDLADADRSGIHGS